MREFQLETLVMFIKLVQLVTSLRNICFLDVTASPDDLVLPSDALVDMTNLCIDIVPTLKNINNTYACIY